jgi:hypothetical protein
MDHQYKLEWARKHLDTLKASIQVFLNSEPYIAIQKYDDEEGGYQARLDRQLEVPLDWSLMVGDIIHNARSALDNLAYALAIKNSGPLSDDDARDVQFVLYEKRPDDFFSRSLFRLGLLSDVARTEIEKLQPYHRPDPAYRHPLAVLADLSNIDKHRHLILAVDTAQSASVSLEGSGIEPGTRIGGYSGPLEDRTVIARWKLAGFPPNAKVNMSAEISILITFPQGRPAWGGSIVGFLDALLDHIRDVVFPPLEAILNEP